MRKEELKNLMEEMTVIEKIGQTVQLTADFFDNPESKITGPTSDIYISEDIIKNSGSVVGLSGVKDVKKIQEEYLKDNRLGIPLLFMADVIHGFKTIFPIPLAMASSFNPKLVEEMARASAKEAAAAGVDVTFSPMVDLVRDPRWGRVMESNGEDPYLNAVMAQAYVRGYQGKNLSEDSLAACVKHFAAYGAPAGGRDYNTVDLSSRVLKEYYLSGYVAAINAGSKMLMTSFNTINGVPASSNKWLLQDYLRDKLGFEGTVISDWAAILEIIYHRTAENAKEAARQAITAGVDIDMMSGFYANELYDLYIHDEEIAVAVDKAVWRILNLKNDLGLFEDPYRNISIDKEKTVLNNKFDDLALEMAEESIVLLKNENNLLPLSKDSKIALTGPFKNSKDILGAWSLFADRDITDLETALEQEFNENISIIPEQYIFEGLYSYKLEDLYTSDVILLALGESSDMSGEAASRADLQLPKDQILLIKELAKLNKPIIGIIYAGRPLILEDIEKYFDTLIYAWFPGAQGSQALVNIISGKKSPSGKLTMSFPKSVGQIPVYYNHESTGRPFYEHQFADKYRSRYLDESNEALYPFGYGLSYSSFSYSEIKLNKDTITRDEDLEIAIDIKNTGEYTAKEVVQIYVQDEVTAVIMPEKELKRFKKIELKPGEKKTLRFTLNAKDFYYTHEDGKKYVEAGKFKLMIGPNSENFKERKFKLVN